MNMAEWICECGGQGLLAGYLSPGPQHRQNWIAVLCWRCGKKLGEYNPYHDEDFCHVRGVGYIYDRRKERAP